MDFAITVLVHLLWHMDCITLLFLRQTLHLLPLGLWNLRIGHFHWTFNLSSSSNYRIGKKFCRLWKAMHLNARGSLLNKPAAWISSFYLKLYHKSYFCWIRNRVIILICFYLNSNWDKDFKNKITFWALLLAWTLPILITQVNFFFFFFRSQELN